MLDALGTRQQQLLRLLLENNAGMTVDEIAGALSITRTAVNQHLAALERDGYICRGDLQKTGGRPGRIYVLTELGSHLFPKQYAWFSKLLLETLKRELGEHGLTDRLRGIAEGLAAGLQGRLVDKSPAERIAEVVTIMNELAYEARAIPSTEGALPVIEAKNCVYHDLARVYPEVCQFDIALLSQMLGRDVVQTECMVRGGIACRFQAGNAQTIGSSSHNKGR